MRHCRSPDGNTLIMSSQDGYCSLVAFEPGELGTPFAAAAAALHTAAVEPPDVVPGTPLVARVRDTIQLDQPSPLTQCVKGINRVPASPHGVWATPWR